MARWLVNQQDRQFAAQDMEELKSLVQSGEIGAYDMLQPPGATDWLYICEVDGLKELVQQAADDDDDIYFRKGWKLPIPLPLILFMIAVVSGYYAYQNYNTLESYKGSTIYGDSFNYSQLLVVENNTLVYSKAEGKKSIDSLKQGQLVAVKGKRWIHKKGDEYAKWYEISLSEDGTGPTGFVAADDVIPGYFLDHTEKLDIYTELYDPIEKIRQSGFAQVANPDEPGHLVMNYGIDHGNRFALTDIIVELTFLDKSGKQVVQPRELKILGSIDAKSRDFIGTLKASEKSKADPLPEPIYMTHSHFQKEYDETELEDGLVWQTNLDFNLGEAVTVDFSGRVIQARSIPDPEILNPEN